LAKVLSYDSAYIALAENLGLPLITADEKQANAAQSVGAKLKPLTDFAPHRLNERASVPL